ncbi:hypothetical protein ACH5RR_036031 [Cinchona calisaya]|uniref:Uncharacterized protein n=1 Tax=Cinchona calisaya TaxID=153742 RepID=A0ABD2Y212_9GENT
MADSSENLGGTEECSSNESGWTMYIASPTHESNPDDDDDDDEDEDEDEDEDNAERKEYEDVHDEYGGEGESDDSMTSDASSGPSHQGGPRGTSRRSHDRHIFEHEGGKVKRSSSGKKDYKQDEKRPSAVKTKAAKEEQGHKGKSASGTVYSKGKPRKR